MKEKLGNLPDERKLTESRSLEVGNGWQKRYWFIFSGQAFSIIGSALTQFVLMWWIADTTGSVSALAFAGTVALLPQALLSPVGGVFADRYSRRLIMILADLISAVCIAVLMLLFLTDYIELWHIYLIMGIRGAMQAFQSPAVEASTAMLVPESFIQRAAGLNQILMGASLVASAPLGALAVSIMPFGWALSIDLFTALLGIAPLFFFTIPQFRKEINNRHLIKNIISELREGVTMVWKHQGLKRLFILLGGIVLVIMPTFTFVPLLVKEYFKGGIYEVGLMEALAGAGMVAGGVLVTIMAPKRKMIWILAGLGLSCFAISFTALVPANLFWLATFFWMISSIAFIFANAPLTALLQTIIPNQIQGRVLSLLNMIMGLAAPVGLLIANPLGEWIGLRWLFILVGFLGGLVALSGFASRRLKNIEKEGIG
ncbi:MFS transporter [Chryseobacterium sp. Ch-15]|uniref:Multidrug efflux pump Tap n=1 Tax=Chryseobacterium muglaense TaxID=2893752 RepID=A0A9Q3YTS3_9FLAO|nr:MFS transporter [Chryseobacterium muglaense]MBD3906456.1 MFS transporter [Chryseobacterium muglaense]MCC9036833.1 MFS transporter [Chryseobacterium muglaense]MCM2556159.1 MFS transporter [Chryseobacterium muglaense]